MKLTDLKREHFPNGHAFSQKALDNYMHAYLAARKDYFTRYPLTLLIGVAAGFVVLTLMPQGMLRIFLALLCVMGSALIAVKITAKSMDALKEQSRHMLITRSDIRVAKKNLRRGTVAWQAEQETIEE